MELDFETGFCSSHPDFHLNGNKPSYPSYLDSDGCALRLTSDHDQGSMATAYLPLTVHSTSWSTHIKYRIYGDHHGTADGMAFIMQQDPRGQGALGAGTGGYFGVYSTAGGSTAVGNDSDTVKPAIVVEMDSCKSGNF